MLPFLYGLLFFLLQLSIVLITHHPQPFSDSKMIMNRFRIFEKSPTSLSLINDYTVVIPLIRPHFTTLLHSKNLSSLTDDEFLVYKTLQQFAIKSLSINCIQPLSWNQPSLNTMKSPFTHIGSFIPYLESISYSNTKKYHVRTHVPIINNTINIPLTKAKTIEIPLKTTLNTYWVPTSLLFTSIMLIGKGLIKTSRNKSPNSHVHVSLLTLDQTLSKSVSTSETLPSNLILSYGTVTATMLKKTQILSQRS